MASEYATIRAATLGLPKPGVTLNVTRCGDYGCQKARRLSVRPSVRPSVSGRHGVTQPQPDRARPLSLSLSEEMARNGVFVVRRGEGRREAD